MTARDAGRALFALMALCTAGVVVLGLVTGSSDGLLLAIAVGLLVLTGSVVARDAVVSRRRGTRTPRRPTSWRR